MNKITIIELPKLQRLALNKKFNPILSTELTDELNSLVEFSQPHIDNGEGMKDVPWTDEHLSLFDDVSTKILTAVNEFNSQFVDLPKARDLFKQKGISLQMLADEHGKQTQRPVPYSVNTIKRALTGVDNSSHQYDEIQLWLIEHARAIEEQGNEAS
ncbi:MAG: hypothetical protein RLT87_07420 [Gammaproteobacteria bacterium]